MQQTRDRAQPNREKRIRLAAYAAAERRGFEPGFETEDWLTAEREIDGASAPLSFPAASNHPAETESASKSKEIAPTEDALDSGVEESFPASDPVSVKVTKSLV